MKKVLYVSYDGMTDVLGQSQVLPYLVGLSKAGYRFTLLSCEKKDRFAKQGDLIRKMTEASSIDWVPLRYTRKPPVLSTLLDIRKLTKEAVRLHKEKGFDTVHCRSYIGSMVGLHLKKKFGVKYLFDMRGFWPDEKVDAGQWDLGSPLYNAVYRYFKKKESAFIQQADHIVSLTHRGVLEMKKWQHVRVNPALITVVPCCVDMDLFNRESVDEKARQRLASELRIKEGDVILSYLGSIGTWYMLPEMLDFFVQFKNVFPGAKFLFITGDEHERIATTAAARGITADEIILKGASRKEVPVLLSFSKYSLFFIRPTYSKAASSPTKQGELMAMGIPVVCNTGVGDTDTIVEDFRSGILTKGFSTSDYRSVIERLMATSFSAEGIKKGAKDYFSLEKGIGLYKNVYQQLMA